MVGVDTVHVFFFCAFVSVHVTLLLLLPASHTWCFKHTDTKVSESLVLRASCGISASPELFTVVRKVCVCVWVFVLPPGDLF